MNSKNLINKYINDTFVKGLIIIDESPFSSKVVLIDGVISLLCLGNEITIYINDKPYEKVIYNNDCDLWQIIEKY